MSTKRKTCGLLTAGLLAVVLVLGCDVSEVTSSSVVVVCIIDGDTLLLNSAGSVVNSTLACADLADSLSLHRAMWKGAARIQDRPARQSVGKQRSPAAPAVNLTASAEVAIVSIWPGRQLHKADGGTSSVGGFSPHTAIVTLLPLLSGSMSEP